MGVLGLLGVLGVVDDAEAKGFPAVSFHGTKNAIIPLFTASSVKYPVDSSIVPPE